MWDKVFVLYLLQVKTTNVFCFEKIKFSLLVENTK